MSNKILFLFLLMTILSCGKDDEREREIASIPVEVEVTRFDKRFGRATEDSLSVLKSEFPYLFPQQYSDEFWVGKINDTIQKELHMEVAKEFPDLSNIKEELRSLFQHIVYYFPEAEIPEVITLTSEVDYRNKVIWAENLLLISLDTYLGEEHHFYDGIQQYIRKNFEKEQIVSDVAMAFAENILEQPTSRHFLGEMIYYGKILYLKDRLIPFKTDPQKIGYTREELDWARANEEQIWRYFIDRELLYDTDGQLPSRFLYPAPFSKFYLKLDNEAPPKLGQYIGWRIVRQYMERNDVSLREMLQKDAEELFNNSNYKPKK